MPASRTTSVGSAAAVLDEDPAWVKVVLGVVKFLVMLVYVGSIAWDCVALAGCMAVFTTDGAPDNQKISYLALEVLSFVWMGLLAFTTLQSSPLHPKYFSTIKRNMIVNTLVNSEHDIEYVGTAGLPLLGAIGVLATNVVSRYIASRVKFEGVQAPLDLNSTKEPEIVQAWNDFCPKSMPDNINGNDCCPLNVVLRNTKWLALALLIVYIKTRSLSGMKIAINPAAGLIIARMKSRKSSNDQPDRPSQWTATFGPPV